MQMFKAAVLMAMMTAIAFLPIGATAQTLAPPGNSGIQQYKETLPAPGGNEVADGAHPPAAKALGKGNANKLNQFGVDGRAAAELAAATAPARHSDNHPAGVGAASGSSGLAETLGQAAGFSGSSEMGPLFPLVIVATILGAIAYVVTRRRAASG
jgi:hypothetical protein